MATADVIGFVGVRDQDGGAGLEENGTHRREGSPVRHDDPAAVLPSITSMKRVAAACFVGSAIEFYDFFHLRHAMPPLIAGTLQATYGSWAIGVMLTIIAAVSLVCTYLLPETTGAALQSIRRGADDVASVES